MLNPIADGPPEVYPRRWIALGVLLVAGIMNLIDVTIVNVALPGMQAAFNATDSQIEWVVASYILVFALGLLPFGRMGDVVGRRRMFIIGLGVFTFGSTLCGLAPNMQSLIAARVLQGAGGAMMIPQTLAFTPALFSTRERALAYSLFGLSAGFASVTGPILGGALMEGDILGLGWRPIFLVNIPVGLVAIIAARLYLPRLPGIAESRIDFVGILVAALALFCLIGPLIEGRQLGWPLWCVAMMAGSVPLAALFLRWQRHQRATGGPELVPASLITNRGYHVGLAMIGLLFSGIPGFFLVLSIFLQNGLGMSPLEAGLTTSPFSFGMLIASLASGLVGGRWPRRRITLGALLLAFSMIGLQVVVLLGLENATWQWLAPPLLAGGLGLGLSLAPIFQIVLAGIPRRDCGSGSGALQSFQQIGGTLGLAIMSEIFFGRLGALAGHSPPKLAYANSLGAALFFNTFCFIAVAILVTLNSKNLSFSVHYPAAEAG